MSLNYQELDDEQPQAHRRENEDHSSTQSQSKFIMIKEFPGCSYNDINGYQYPAYLLIWCKNYIFLRVKF